MNIFLSNLSKHDAVKIHIENIQSFFGFVFILLFKIVRQIAINISKDI